MALRNCFLRCIKATARNLHGFQTVPRAAARQFSTVGIESDILGEKGTNKNFSHFPEIDADSRRKYSSGTSAKDCIFELRTYTLKPHLIAEYLECTDKYGSLRSELNPGWLGFWTTETGGVLNEVKHLYAFQGGWEERDSIRSTMAATPEWTSEYLPLVRPMVDKQENMILVEDTDCMAAAGALSGRHVAVTQRPSPSPVYEFRTYELEAGYQAVPQLKDHFLRGLPDRVAAPGCGQCMFMGYSDVGTLNTFLEIWRHESTAAHLEARKGGRTATKWRETIQAVAPLTKTFRTELLRPTAFCPWEK